MKTRLHALLALSAILLLSACSEYREKATRVFTGGVLYTVNDNQPTAEAIAIDGNKIVYVGDQDGVQAFIGPDTEVINLQGKTLTPGWIEGHGHFMGLGYNELNLDLSDTKSFQEIVDRVKAAVEKTPAGEWITGRGWHQSKWTESPGKEIAGFPLHHALSEISPNHPVFLYHASGHAGFANARAMEIAGLNPLGKEQLSDPEHQEGGEIIRDENGNPTGVFNETAMGLITRHIPANSPEKDRQAFELAMAACHRNGITGFHDAGVGSKTVDLYQQMKREGKMELRMYAMIAGGNREFLEEWLERGPVIDSLLTFRSIKLSCDGALGSRGAWLLEEYSDRPGHFGHETMPMEYVYEISKMALQNGFQLCTHAIGDRANNEVLDRYQAALEEYPDKSEDHRFRIEHAQHLHPEDIPRFAALGVLPAMQAIHLSSDRPWAIERLGEQRIKEGAYMWQALLQSGVPIINGTDVPVEPINPLANFYASVTRKTLDGSPEGGYEADQKMTREQALRSYTMDAAYGSFEESMKGSLEIGKVADFTVFDRNIMEIPEAELLQTQVIMTVMDGAIVYQQ
ncbi:amidohydrolase [Cyclobacterium jeungdonense]|uniref:Amidohydrolase family protein n=1 Tax=Cyclobacterium jeungdonense TaxID=708087 RepID=A0ABT8C1W1_9BACT|nr:amidohydrolase [Cyclobacterium jeungdonense]MDN3686342.1 amidohydrolase family protein [Cyclobacterium jeungdonense]